MDFLTSGSKFRVYVRQGSNTERHLMKDKLREHKESFSWFMQTFVDTTFVIVARYFLLFVDDYSRKMWVYSLKMKYEVLNEFQKFKALVKKIKVSHYHS
jgi:hypothetical protein